jgi:hypothetical protein
VLVVQAAALLAVLALVVELAQPLPVRLHHRLPRVALLAADELVAVVAAVIGGAAVLPVVVVVGDQVAVDAGLVEQLGTRVVERLERAPAAMQEGQPPGLHVPPGRHAGQAADVVAVEGHGALGEAAEIGRLEAGAAIGTERQAVEGIEQHEDQLHSISPHSSSSLATVAAAFSTT